MNGILSAVDRIALLFLLLAGSALLPVHSVHAQNAAGNQDQAAAAEGGALEEIIVTATKRADSVNKVPISITALPQSALEAQDIRNIQDVSRAVPGLFATTSNTANGERLSIRGVSSGLGASTTGIYLDDIPLQKRLVAGATSGSGTPFPPLFDLDRVEVLRGPQGTLYGAGSEGGNVRLITPTPNLTDYSAVGRAELSGTENGGTNYELGAAVGGPIVQDKMGFRVSLWDRHDSGYIDHVYLYTGQTLGTDTNTENRTAAHIAVLWEPTDDLKITPAFYISRDHYGDADSYTENVPFFSVGATTNVPAHAYGPYNYFGPYKSSANCNIGSNFVNSVPPCFRPSSRTTTLNVPSLSIDYDFGDFAVHSSTSYASDVNKGLQENSFADLGGPNAGIPLLPTIPIFAAGLLYDNARHTATEELRVASTPNDGPWSWVGGLFTSNQDTHQRSQDYTSGYDAVIFAISNQTVTQKYGAPTDPDGGISLRDQKITETEYAAFGELTYAPIDDLKLIGGLRASRDEIAYSSYLEGPFFGYSLPTIANGGLTRGHQGATAVLPKFGVQYDLDETSNIYVTAAEGNRVGGVNTGAYTSKCASTFTSLGLSGTPATYDQDSLWSYEVGAKIRVGNRAQINSSLYYVDWSKVQVTFTLPSPCGFSYTSNAGGAISKGGDVQAQLIIFDGLTASASFAYTDAHYTDAVVGPAPTSSVLLPQGAPLPVPVYSYNIGLRYDFPILEDYKAYISGNFYYNSSYYRSFGPAASSWSIDTYIANQTRFATLRGGFTVAGMDVAIFVDNLFNSQDLLSRSGGRSCRNASCTSVASNNPILTDSTFRPRTIGVNLNYKY